MEKLEHFRHTVYFYEFNREAKAAEAATNIGAVYGDNAIGGSTERNGLFVLRRIVLTLVTLHVQAHAVLDLHYHDPFNHYS